MASCFLLLSLIPLLLVCPLLTALLTVSVRIRLSERRSLPTPLPAPLSVPERTARITDLLADIIYRISDCLIQTAEIMGIYRILNRSVYIISQLFPIPVSQSINTSLLRIFPLTARVLSFYMIKYFVKAT